MQQLLNKQIIILDGGLHKIADTGLEKIYQFIELVKNNKNKPSPTAFKPVKLSALLRPHPLWYLRRYEKRIIEYSITTVFLMMMIFLLIKNWR